MTDTVTQTAEEALQLIRAAMREVSATAGALKGMRDKPQDDFAVSTLAACNERLSDLYCEIRTLAAAMFCRSQEDRDELLHHLTSVPAQRTAPGSSDG
jgi:hypothetical protein